MAAKPPQLDNGFIGKGLFSLLSLLGYRCKKELPGLLVGNYFDYQVYLDVNTKKYY